MDFKCKMCGGTLKVEVGQTVVKCEYCGVNQTLPVFDDEKKIAFYNRANSLRRECEFDKAAGIYEMIVTEFSQEAEAFWGLVLCKYGIEYIDDPKNGKKVPTCHRTLFTSIFDDSDYKNAIRHSDVVARELYREEAERIDTLQKRILEISAKEDPFDVFICYKESTTDGARTEDSVLAFDIYNELTRAGYKVFFSKVTLESKLGNEYEPYIFSALYSSRLMILVTTSKENCEAVWVKNEWSRYMSLAKSGERKTIISCFKGINASQLPTELQSIQGLDMTKLGAMQDLLHGVGKIIGKSYTLRDLDEDEDSDFEDDYEDDSADDIDYQYEKNVQELNDIDSFCSYSSDIKPIIDFFASVGDYREAKKYLIEAKYQYALHVNSFADCLQAVNYLGEIKDEKDVREAEIKCVEQARKFRFRELQNKGFAVPIYAEITSITFYSTVTKLIDTYKKDLQDIDDFDKGIIEESRENAIKFILENFGKVLEAENKKAELTKIRDAILICSPLKESEREGMKSRINEKIALIEIAEQQTVRKKKIKKITTIATVLGVFLIIAIIIASVFAIRQKGYAADNFKISVLSKTNDSFNEDLADGYRGSGYFYTFKFEVSNGSRHGITKLEGNMDVNNANGKTLSSSTATLTGSLDSKSTGTWNLQLNVYKGDNAREIWNTEFASLEITFRITSITFDDGTTKYYSDTRNQIVHSINN